ncbi:MAG: type II 3-dehydroquinate dehydratase [Parvularculaceae bacterium]
MCRLKAAFARLREPWRDSMLIYVLNGPNLNLLGKREPHIYGSATLGDVQNAVEKKAAGLGLRVDFRQSNHEGVLVDWIQEAREKAAGLVLNPGAYTHTSVAIHDALKALTIPTIEVHLSNIHAREAFRRHSFVSPAATGVICGLGAEGYLAALDALKRLIDKGPKG